VPEGVSSVEGGLLLTPAEQATPPAENELRCRRISCKGGKNVEQQHATRLAWESFLRKGKPPQGIPQTVASSWERSRTLGVAIERGKAPLAGEPEVFRRRSQNAILLTAARPALQRSSFFLAEAACMMILSDPSGFIIETAGDPRIVDQGRRNHLEIGGNWEEGAIGTNNRDSSRGSASRPYPRSRAFLRGRAALGLRGSAGALFGGRGAAWGD
jgi:hypothetical protein